MRGAGIAQKADRVAALCGGGESLRTGGEYGLSFIVGVHRRGPRRLGAPPDYGRLDRLGFIRALSYRLIQTKLNMVTRVAGNDQLAGQAATDMKSILWWGKGGKCPMPVSPPTSRYENDGWTLFRD